MIEITLNSNDRIYAQEPLLVTGTPRSGTQAVAEWLNLDHENDTGNERGIVSFMQFSDARTWNTKTGGDVIQLTRDPMNTIPSLMDLCHPKSGHWRWMMEAGFWSPMVERNSYLRDYLDPHHSTLANAASYWFAVNGHLLFETGATVVPLESLAIYEPNRETRNPRTDIAEIHRHSGCGLAVGVLTICELIGYESGD